MSHILVVDDEPSICWGFREFLTDDGHDVSIAASAEEGLTLAEKRAPDAIVLDVRLPGMDGLTAIREFRGRVGPAPIVVITAFGDLDTAVRAVREGAFDYLPKPFDLDQAAEIVGRALEIQRSTDTANTQRDVASPADGLIGAAPSMQQVFKQIALVAASEVPVLITGESGTGKELVARAIHRNSPNASEPFLPVCLAALSSGVVESELFGHVKGAFTGAANDRIGLLELAGAGTVLLDEIGDITPALQVKLLRVLEQREVTPVGDARPRPFQARLIAATNRSLPEMIRSGEFREDLYFRLSVFHIHLPPLRDRKDDIPLLAEHFLRRCRAPGVSTRMSPAILEALAGRAWTGNVRELRNVIEHAAIVSRGGALGTEHLPPATLPHVAAAEMGTSEQVSAWARQQSRSSLSGAENGVYDQYLALVEPPLLRAVLEECSNNRALAAQRLGIHRATLRQKLRKYGIG